MYYLLGEGFSNERLLLSQAWEENEYKFSCMLTDFSGLRGY